MRHYEIVAVIHPDQSDRVGVMATRYRDLITEDGGAVHRFEDWGRRQLSYPIQKVFKAHYILLNVECGSDTLRKLEENFNFNDAVLRTLITRRNRPVTAASPMKMLQEQEENTTGEEE